MSKGRWALALLAVALVTMAPSCGPDQCVDLGRAIQAACTEDTLSRDACHQAWLVFEEQCPTVPPPTCPPGTTPTLVGTPLVRVCMPHNLSNYGIL